MAARRNDLSLDDLRELAHLLGIQVRGDRRKRDTYLVALSEFLSTRMQTKRLNELFELEASIALPSIYKALEF
jgi:hypothetical protein